MAYGKVHETFWDDPVIRGLTEDGRTLMFYLITCRHKNRLGCYVLDLSYAAADLQWPIERVTAALDLLVERNRVLHDPENRVIVVLRYLKHNKLENRNVVAGAISELNGLPATPLLVELLARVQKYSLPHYDALIQELTNRSANGSGNHSETVTPTNTQTHGFLSRSRSRSRNQTDERLLSQSARGAGRSKTKPKRRSATPQRNGPPTLHQQAMPVLRELGYAADATDGSILKAIKAKGLGWEQLEPAIRGLAMLRDEGALTDRLGIRPGEQLNVRILYARDGPKVGAQPIWRVAEERYERHVAEQYRRNRNTMSTAGQALKRAL